MRQSSKAIRMRTNLGPGLPIPHNEDARLDAVVGLNQTHAETQPALIALRNTARALLRTPVAFIGFIEEESQRLLTVCVVPQEESSTTGPIEFKEMLTPRNCSLCQFTIMESDHLVIPDLIAFLDGKTGENFPAAFREQAKEVGGYPIPWPSPDGGVVMKPALFYAGATIRTKAGLHVGTFCVVDVVPRPDFGRQEVDILEGLAAQAAAYLEERAVLRRPPNLQLLQRVQQRSTQNAPADEDVDVVVLGAGPAGTTAACRLSFQGLRVALVEPKEQFGSPTGVNSKVLREVALECGADTTWDRVRDIRDLIAAQDSARVATQLARYGVTLVPGRGAIESVSDQGDVIQVGVTNASGSRTTLTTRATVVSTGSKARRLEGIPFDVPGFYDSDSINGLREKPDSLLIQGTGVIALEYATIFAKMGVQVTVVSRRPKEALLPNLDRSLQSALLTALDDMGVEMLYACTVQEWGAEDGRPHVTLALPSGLVSRRVDAVLSAVGRVPVMNELGLERLLGESTQAHTPTLEPDSRHRLDAGGASVYAVGDVSGTGLACRAVVQAQQVVDDVLGQLVHDASYSDPVSRTGASKVGTASVIWAIPELAFVGDTEQEAKERYGEGSIFTVVSSFSETVRGSLSGVSDRAFLKLVCLRQDGRIVGVHIYGDGASELVHLAASLVANNETVFTLQYRTFPAVTLHEVYRNAALQAIDVLSALSRT